MPSATRRAWSLALATEMSGSSPLPDAVTASTGTGNVCGQPVLRAVGTHEVVDPGRLRLVDVGCRRVVLAVEEHRVGRPVVRAVAVVGPGGVAVSRGPRVEVLGRR